MKRFKARVYKHGYEKQVQEDAENKLKIMGWHVMRTHGNTRHG